MYCISNRELKEEESPPSLAEGLSVLRISNRELKGSGLRPWGVLPNQAGISNRELKVETRAMATAVL